MTLQETLQKDLESLTAAVHDAHWHNVKCIAKTIAELAEQIILDDLYKDDEDTPFWQK